MLSGQRGSPLAVAVTGAPLDKMGALATLDGLVADRSGKVVYRLHHLCLNKGYEYADVIEEFEERENHIHLLERQAEKASKLSKKKHSARRWMVE